MGRLGHYVIEADEHETGLCSRSAARRYPFDWPEGAA